MVVLLKSIHISLIRECKPSIEETLLNADITATTGFTATRTTLHCHPGTGTKQPDFSGSQWQNAIILQEYHSLGSSFLGKSPMIPLSLGYLRGGCTVESESF
jgi:hypothetical protein